MVNCTCKREYFNNIKSQDMRTILTKLRLIQIAQQRAGIGALEEKKLKVEHVPVDRKNKVWSMFSLSMDIYKLM